MGLCTEYHQLKTSNGSYLIVGKGVSNEENMRIETLLIHMGRIAESDSSYAEKAKSLIDWHYTHGWTKKQESFCKKIVLDAGRRKKDKKSKEKGGYQLYAIDDGVNIKLGYANNPKSRLKALQTGNANKLTLLWTYPAGDYETIARKLEKNLHRYCRRFKKRGEWFSKDCLPTVQKFEMKRKLIDAGRAKKAEEKKNAEDAQDIEMAYEASQFI